MRDIAKIIKQSCEFMSLTEIIYMLKSLEENKPQFVIDYHNIRVREIIHYQSSSKTEKVVDTLQMPCFDKNVNDKKCIEVILAENVKYGIDQLNQHAQQCKQLIRKDLLIELYDSYFLDELNMLYVVEYESFQAIDMCNQSMLQRSIFGVQTENILEYLTLSIFPQPSDVNRYSFSFRFQFGLTEGTNENKKLKLNPFDPYILCDPVKEVEQPPIPIIEQEEEEEIEESLRLFNISSVSQGPLIHRDKLIELLQQTYPKIYDLHGEVISEIIKTKSDYQHFSLIKFDEHFIEMSVEKDDKISFGNQLNKLTPSFRIRLNRYSINPTDTKIHEVIRYHDKLKELNNISSVIEKQEIISFSTCQYVLFEINQKKLSQCKSIQSHLNQSRLLQYQYKSQSTVGIQYSKEVKNKCQELIDILEYMLEMFHPLLTLNIRIEYLYTHQKTNQFYYSDLVETKEQQSVQTQNNSNHYMNYVLEIIKFLSIYFPRNQRNKHSRSYEDFISSVKAHLNYETHENNVQLANQNWLNLQQMIKNFKQLININKEFSKLYLKFSERNMNLFQFGIPKDIIPKVDIEQFLPLFKDNDNITKISFDENDFGRFIIQQFDDETLSLQTDLADTQPNLTSWNFYFNGKDTQFQKLQNTLDFFNLASKQSLESLRLTYPQIKYLKEIYQQLKNNNNNINTIYLHSNQFYSFKKLKRLVCIKLGK